MNSNRNSNSNRRRGRNPNRPQGGSSGGSGGGNQLNRIDSRARGNAPQLLDKYKKLAQDAQHNGDRVQAEYFLQFADHYFRVINDNKLRQDEARAQRTDKGGRDDQGDGPNDGQSQRGDDDNRRPRRQRSRDDEADTRDDDSDDRGNGDRSGGSRARGNDGRDHNGRGNGADHDHDDRFSDDADAPRAPNGRAKTERSPRKPRAPKPAADNDGEIDIAALPPAIGKSSGDAPVKKPALRPRRKRADDSETLV